MAMDGGVSVHRNRTLLFMPSPLAPLMMPRRENETASFLMSMRITITTFTVLCIPVAVHETGETIQVMMG